MHNARGESTLSTLSGGSILIGFQGMVELIKKDSEKGFGDLF